MRNDVDDDGQSHQCPQQCEIPFGVAMLPAHKQPGSPTGGGNFYISKKAPAEQQTAALRFIQWMTSPERAAQWSIDTGYVAVRPDAYDTPAMKAYVDKFPPAAVARDQLKYATAELSTHENQRVTKSLNDAHPGDADRRQAARIVRSRTRRPRRSAF